jgi:hypothetical protein
MQPHQGKFQCVGFGALDFEIRRIRLWFNLFLEPAAGWNDLSVGFCSPGIPAVFALTSTSRAGNTG